MFDFRLRNRYLFEATLTLHSPLHVGTGLGDGLTDSAVARTPDGLPFIPGSSFKGVLRSGVERLAPALGFATCALTPGTHATCPTANDTEKDAYEALRERRGTTERDLVNFLSARLCDTCRLFGSPFAASRLRVEDLRLSNRDPEVFRRRAVRDGVGIDRDTGAARERIKFDAEIVPADATFSVRLLLENAEPGDVALLCLGLADLTRPRGLRIGGLTSRGLGWGELRNLTARSIDFEHDSRADILAHVLRGAWPRTETGEAFLSARLSGRGA